MKKWISFVAVGILAGQLVWAGDFKGNGGSSVRCPGQSLRILDFFEMQEPLNLGPADLSLEAKAEFYFQRVQFLSPVRATLYRDWFKNFQAESVFLNGIPIDNIPDTDFTPPPGCELVQVVNQNPALLPAGKHYLVDLVLWNALDVEQKLGLIFHEFLYRESLAKTSKMVRALNALIASARILSFTSQQITELMKRAEMPWAEVQGVVFDLAKAFSFDAKGTLRAAVPVAHSFYQRDRYRFELRGDAIEFCENGIVQKLRFFGTLPYTLGSTTVHFENNEYDHVYMQFYPSGAVQEGPLTWYQEWKLSTADAELVYHYLRLSPSGVIELVSDASGGVLLPGQRLRIMDKSEVQFYPRGQVAQFVWGSSDAVVAWGQKIFPQYGTLVKLFENSSLSAFVSSKDGRLQLPDGSWKTFKKGDLVELSKVVH